MNRTSQTFLRSVVRVGTLAIALTALSGCASYIAHRIANPEANEIEADLSQIVETNLACSEPHNCIELYALRHSKSHANDEGFSIDLTLSGGNSTTKWTYAGTIEPIATQVLQNELIIIFPGYMMEPQIVVLLQRWLAHKTRIYMSLKDEIVGSNIELPELLRKESDIVVRQYSSLSHIQMMAMINEALLTDFISDMTNTKVDLDDTQIVGSICVEGQPNCEID
ncbi:MAG: hypothetical protein VX061_13180 [Pseudomonadota bacterium]|nr:hypothetical protein [Pseudomonadota bacterium]